MRIVAVDQVRSMEKSGASASTPWSWKVPESMYKYLQTHWTLKFSNCVLLRVPINNNYELPIALFIILSKNTFMNHHCVISCLRQVNLPMQQSWPLLINVCAKSTCQCLVATSLINKRCQVDLPTQQSRPLLINIGAKSTRQRHGRELY